MKCCFCGHGRYWEVPNSIVALLLETIEYLINYRNVDTFISGGKNHILILNYFYIFLI